MKILKFCTVMTILSIFVFCYNCTYESPFPTNNLISESNMTEWNADNGIYIENTTDINKPNDSSVYFLYLKNIITENNADFENIDATADLNWQISSNDPPYSSKPTVFNIKKDSTELSGTSFLNIQLQKNPYPEYIYYPFDSSADQEYTFRFDYKNISAGNIFLSHGTTGDLDTFEISSSFNEKNSAYYNFYILENSPAHEIRFGYKDPSNDYTLLNLYVDNISLYETSNHSLYQRSLLDNSSFYEGTYKLECYAKAGTSSVAALKINANYKTFELTDSWQHIEFKAAVKIQEDYITIGIMPVYMEERKRTSGGIYISIPELYFLPDEIIQ